MAAYNGDKGLSIIVVVVVFRKLLRVCLKDDERGWLLVRVSYGVC